MISTRTAGRSRRTLKHQHWMGLCVLWVVGSSCSLPMLEVQEKTCSQQFGVIDFSMTARGRSHQPIKALQVCYRVPRPLLGDPGLEDLEKEELLRQTGTLPNQLLYGLASDDVQVVWSDTHLILTFLYQSAALSAYLSTNHPEPMTIESYPNWYLATAGQSVPAVCS